MHQDTVPVEGMSIEPFGGDVRDGRVYGRGACDVKGGMATMLAAISRVASAKHSATPSPTIVLAFTVNEECGYTGARALCELWLHRVCNIRNCRRHHNATRNIPRTAGRGNRC